ncbi:MAG: hypothetical protein HYS12_06905 [Planctomycetes bacterium]|nr:hypothetical protein [Planctomycetota bacterium]
MPERAWERLVRAETAVQATLLRDVFGNPFRNTAADPACLAWSDGTAVKMARAIYEGRDFGDVPLLGDALEEGGCANDEILSHCRGPGLHTRGCWVLDLLLGAPP